MTKFTAFVIIVALRIVLHPSNAQTAIAPFASTTPTESTRQLPASTISISPSKPIRNAGSILDHNLIREWLVNEYYDQLFYEMTGYKKLYLASN